MVDLSTVHELFRYNRWADARIFEAASALTVEQLVKDLGSSHPSVRDTLTHIVWAEWLYLQRWKGTSPRTVFRGSEFPRLHDLKTRWMEVEAEQHDFVQAVTPDRLQSIIEYVNLQGETWRYPLWRQMVHLVNHQSYHRGQIVTMVRQLGARPIATDFLLFHDVEESAVA